MKVRELNPDDVRDKRIEVTGVSIGEAEAAGHVNDTDTLMGQKGRVTSLVFPFSESAQLSVDWDSQEVGLLALMAEDEVQVLT